VEGESVRIADHDVRPGVQVDTGDGDAWPAIREKLVAADIVILSTPIWLGHPSSLAQLRTVRMVRSARAVRSGDPGTGQGGFIRCSRDSR
jgi:hypothetical protein